MRRTVLALVTTAVAAFPPLVHGMASAVVNISPSSSLDINLNSSGHEFEFNGLFPVTLAPGESVDTLFHYTVTVSEDGLPVPPSSDHFCTPLFPSACTPPDTGFEQVTVHFVVGFRDGRAANPFISITGKDFSHQTPTDGTPESFTESGTFDLRIVNADTTNSHSDNFLNYAVAFVDANPLSPIPEPETWGLMLMGLGLYGVSVRRRSPS